MSDMIQPTTENTSTENNSIEIIEFYLGNKIFGIVIDDINRIVQREKLTTVLNSSQALEGVFDLENEVIPVINLFALFNLEGAKEEDDHEDKYIIIKHNHEPVAFHCGNVIRIYTTVYQAPTKEDTAGLKTHKDLIFGVVKNENENTLLVNTAQIINLL